MKQETLWTEEAESKPITTITQSHLKLDGCVNYTIMNGTNSTAQKENQGNPLQVGKKQSLPAGSRSCANPTVAPGSSWARRMTERSGRSFSRSLDGSSRVMSCLKMLLDSSVWRSMACYLTWKRKTTKSGRSYFQLAPSTPRTGGTGYGLLPTLLATPTARDYKDGSAQSCANVPTNGLLGREVHLLPTPTANRWDGLQSHGVNVVEGSLNPAWVEILQGYPAGWTDLSEAAQNAGTATGSETCPESPPE